MIVAQAPGIIPSGEQGIDVFANPSSAQSLQLFQFLSDTQIMDDLLKPKSYLVYLFFDKRMMIDGHYSGIINVKDANQLNILQHHLSAMQRDGYFYTYVTNQSEKKVYFNNLTLVHKRGNIVQSNDYYPLVPMGFGLTWENPKDDLHTYQGKELQRNEWSSGGLDMLDFHARMYNPLIGRWHNPDPMNQFDSPYNAMANNPVVNIDPDGMWSLPLGGIMGSVGSIISNMTTTHIVSPRDMSISTEYTFGHGFGEALQVAGAGLAFWEGGKMLSDGQATLGMHLMEVSSPYDDVYILWKATFTYTTPSGALFEVYPENASDIYFGMPRSQYNRTGNTIKNQTGMDLIYERMDQNSDLWNKDVFKFNIPEDQTHGKQFFHPATHLFQSTGCFLSTGYPTFSIDPDLQAFPDYDSDGRRRPYDSNWQMWTGNDQTNTQSKTNLANIHTLHDQFKDLSGGKMSFKLMMNSSATTNSQGQQILDFMKLFGTK